jgi:cysteine desulfurase / selenocysteine lyase
MSVSFDPKTIKKDFPFFTNRPNLVYLDSAASSQKPQMVTDAITDFYTKDYANIHRGIYDLSEKATAQYEEVRGKVKDFIKARSPKEIIFTSGTTESINLVAQSYARKHLKNGDEIIVTAMEHHANLVPWQVVAKQTGAKLRIWDITDDGTLDSKELNKLLNRQTKLLAITHVSNVLGVINDLKWITQKAHAVNAKVIVDAAQSVPHMGIDVEYLDCDFLAFSTHKMLGPTGVGVLYAKERHLEEMDPWLYGGDMIREVTLTKSTWNDAPWRFEAGTPNIAGVIGLGAAIDYLKNIGMNNIRTHEQYLIQKAIESLGSLPYITIYGPKDIQKRSGVLSFSIDGVHPHDIAQILDEDEIAIRVGHHCAMPLTKRLGVAATARASFYLYNTDEDIERLVNGLEKVYKVFT